MGLDSASSCFLVYTCTRRYLVVKIFSVLVGSRSHCFCHSSPFMIGSEPQSLEFQWPIATGKNIIDNGSRGAAFEVLTLVASRYFGSERFFFCVASVLFSKSSHFASTSAKVFRSVFSRTKNSSNGAVCACRIIQSSAFFRTLLSVHTLLSLSRTPARGHLLSIIRLEMN